MSLIATADHLLGSETPHFAWDNSLPPRLEIRSGETVMFETRDAGNGRYTPATTLDDVRSEAPPTFRGHPLTGPVWVEGARPGDTLQVDILSVKPGSFGWTRFGPGSGLLPDDFAERYIRTWDLSDGQYAWLGERIRVPLGPFCGVMGVALAEPGEHSTIPPRQTGGNMDIRQLSAGSTLFLPVEVDGALFSVGDAHAAQGDGEVCVTAIEMSATVTLRFSVRHDMNVVEPQFRTAGRRSAGPAYVTTAHGPDLLQNSRQAIRYMLDHLVSEYGLTREDAYILSSVAVDLRISQVVDAPNWTVSAFLPLDIFV